jgi:hypothetical protein
LNLLISVKTENYNIGKETGYHAFRNANEASILKIHKNPAQHANPYIPYNEPDYGIVGFYSEIIISSKKKKISITTSFYQ